ncbi:hypothetical protein DFH09DRAFT_1453040 [Mycena vulgaris]|nr:hypothetical protein DFH09DRAFT_1453040 [Mycena vulgaris]
MKLLFSRAPGHTPSTPSKHKAQPPPTLSPGPSLPRTDEFGRTRSHYYRHRRPFCCTLFRFFPHKQRDEGHLPHGQCTAFSPVLGLPDAARFFALTCAELERTGLVTPFVFRALALDVRPAAVARLVHAFLATCAEGAGAGGGGTVCRGF